MNDIVKKAAVIGWPIKHSKSPLIHGYWLDKYKINGSYEAIGFSSDDFKAGVQDLMAQGFRGCNVTIPHKETALVMADVISDRAKAIGAANTLVFINGLIHADNTDGIGFINNLKQGVFGWKASRGPALVLGAGGAARAIVYALLQDGAPNVVIANRTLSKAQNLVGFFGDKVSAIEISNIEGAMPYIKTLINTTSLGMTGQPELDLDISKLPIDAWVTDIVYNPLRTELLKQADSLRLTNVDGLGMLLHQAVPGFEAWFGRRPEVDAELRAKVLAK